MKKILIVEDDPITEKILVSHLKKAGYEVSVARDAVNALSTAFKAQPDLALLDISMPGGDGFTVADRIKSSFPREIPFIFLTANKHPNLRRRAELLGAVDYIEKPYETADLMAAIEGALSEH